MRKTNLLMHFAAFASVLALCVLHVSGQQQQQQLVIINTVSASSPVYVNRYHVPLPDQVDVNVTPLATYNNYQYVSPAPVYVQQYSVGGGYASQPLYSNSSNYSYGSAPLYANPALQYGNSYGYSTRSYGSYGSAPLYPNPMLYGSGTLYPNPLRGSSGVLYPNRAVYGNNQPLYQNPYLWAGAGALYVNPYAYQTRSNQRRRHVQHRQQQRRHRR